ncbi:MarR family transcriptional regulator [Mycolicibacterium grossiae]|uniref:MarR family transcriptional regulator n=1 Tax=Mycolicibacterium grossiae TaxID=1552759 RepID=UPI000F79AB3C|nr:MarR family transcriptional regulator [Mycolicibacterium grossiae]QEM43578.1 MarR family transcriptional regulator [Mycolicibacterium grossiae]
MSTTDAAALRRRSRVAFGQDYQLEVMLLVADAEGVVHQKAVAAELGLSPSNVQTPWDRLVDLGLLTFELRDKGRHKCFKRARSSGWEYARELAGSLWQSHPTYWQAEI